MDKEKEIVFWDTDDAEVLYFSDQNEAIEKIIDCLDVVPDEIEVCGYKRISVSTEQDRLIESVSEHVLEYLDENYGGEDPVTEVSDIKDVSQDFITKVVEIYTPWRCEVVKREKINTRQWVEGNAPEWLSDITWENPMK